MNKAEARHLLEEAVQELRAMTRPELERLLNEQEVAWVHGKSGTTYQIEKQAMWDDKKGHDLRVMVTIDDGGWHSLFPLSADFIIATDGSFVGE